MKRLIDGTIVDVEDLPLLTTKELAKQDTDRVNSAVSRVWQAAHEYETDQISGSAVGMLVFGVSQGLPKSTAVQVWLGSIWDLYYQRKQLLIDGAELDDVLTDYSPCGEIPHTIPELRTEIGF